MAKNYILRSTTSDLTGGADFNRDITVGSASTLATLSVQVARVATEISYGYTVAGEPGINGATGDYTVEIDVQTGNNNIFGSIAVARVNSSGVQQNISSNTAEQQLTAGTKTFTLSAVNLGTWVSGDRLRVSYRLRNAANSAQSVVLGFNTANSEVLTPFTLAISSGAITNSSISSGTVTGRKGTKSAGISNSSTSSATVTGNKGVKSNGISNSSTSSGTPIGNVGFISHAITNSSTSSGTVTGTKEGGDITEHSGHIDASSTSTGTVTGTIQVSSNSQSNSSSTSASATGAPSLFGSSSNSSTSSGTVLGVEGGFGAIVNSSTSTGLVVGNPALNGTVTDSTIADATIVGAKGESGIVTGSSTSSGTAVGAKTEQPTEHSGHIDASSDSSGSVTGYIGLFGYADNSNTSDGTVSGSIGYAGSITGENSVVEPAVQGTPQFFGLLNSTTNTSNSNSGTIDTNGSIFANIISSAFIAGNPALKGIILGTSTSTGAVNPQPVRRDKRTNLSGYQRPFRQYVFTDDFEGEKLRYETKLGFKVKGVKGFLGSGVGFEISKGNIEGFKRFEKDDEELLLSLGYL